MCKTALYIWWFCNVKWIGSYLTDTINHAYIQLKIMLHFPLELKNSALHNGGILVGWRAYFYHFVKVGIPCQGLRIYAFRRFLMYNKVHNFCIVFFVWSIWYILGILFLQVIPNDAKQMDFFLIYYDTYNCTSNPTAIP